jgi:hypothetical protein
MDRMAAHFQGSTTIITIMTTAITSITISKICSREKHQIIFFVFIAKRILILNYIKLLFVLYCNTVISKRKANTTKKPDACQTHQARKHNPVFMSV